MAGENQQATVEMILVKLARRFAPRLVPNDWRKAGDLKQPLYVLARQLANDHILVLLGARASHDPEGVPAAVRECAELYSRFYRLLVDALFTPELKRIQAAYFSYSRDQLLIYFDADAGPVIQVMAGFVAPYVAQRQSATEVTVVELYGLMEFILETLEADDMAPATYRQLREQGAAIIKRMLEMRLQQQMLTQFDEPIATEIRHVMPPGSLPEEGATRPFTTTNEQGHDALPDFLREILEAGSSVQSAPPGDKLSETGQQPRTMEPDEDRPAPQEKARKGTGPLPGTGSTGPLSAPLPQWKGGKRGKNST